jgi:hypothetical protein
MKEAPAAANVAKADTKRTKDKVHAFCVELILFQTKLLLTDVTYVRWVERQTMEARNAASARTVEQKSIRTNRSIVSIAHLVFGPLPVIGVAKPATQVSIKIRNFSQSANRAQKGRTTTSKEPQPFRFVKNVLKEHIRQRRASQTSPIVTAVLLAKRMKIRAPKKVQIVWNVLLAKKQSTNVRSNAWLVH